MAAINIKKSENHTIMSKWIPEIAAKTPENDVKPKNNTKIT